MPVLPDSSLRSAVLGVAACIADHGVAFIEDEKVEALEATLLAFFRAADVAVQTPELVIRRCRR